MKVGQQTKQEEVLRECSSAEFAMSDDEAGDGACDVRAPFTAKDREVLARIVREAQERKMEGDKGAFLEFLQKTQPKNYIALTRTNPTTHHFQVLVDFVETLTEKKHRTMIKRHRRYQHQLLREKTARLDAAAKQRKEPDAPKGEASAGLDVWQLVKLTEKHQLFNKNYTLPSYGKGWVRTPRSPEHPTSKPAKIYAMDCEMCTTTRGDRELLGVSVVDSDGAVVVKTLVQPRGAVADLKTGITGITTKDLEGVTTTLYDVQKQVFALCQDSSTVLIGHSLQHDLMTLQIDHRPVIDTALVYKYTGLAILPGLAYLAEEVLEKPIRDSSHFHSSEEDARASLHLVQHLLKIGMIPPVPPPNEKVPKELLMELFVHRLPPEATEDAVRSLFQPAADAEAGAGAAPIKQLNVTIKNLKVEAGKKFGTASAVFDNIADANDAFKALVGESHKDGGGRQQKKVQLMLSTGEGKPMKGHNVQVRKNAGHGGMKFQPAKEPVDGAQGKRKRGVEVAGGKEEKQGVQKAGDPGQSGEGSANKRMKATEGGGKGSAGNGEASGGATPDTGEEKAAAGTTKDARGGAKKARRPNARQRANLAREAGKKVIRPQKKTPSKKDQSGADGSNTSKPVEPTTGKRKKGSETRGSAEETPKAKKEKKQSTEETPSKEGKEGEH
ncbi:hypothetical protein CYMTET_45101 [Cymbomonas tetramitiformis]|uniref:RRM domain-containing protein n=1 Tax=Cymbomonas tetramitiformis TaxID=36881 RepID=A0AAE0C045_9CHLO|nr:hypothetical protein CYMTET_45101 [Cymbomonas tetramitiformis]